MIKAIFFDFNGVIIDDEGIQMRAYTEVLRGHDIDLPEEWYLDALGMNDRTFVEYVFDRAQKPSDSALVDQVLEKKIELHRGMIEDELPFFPGVLSFLKTTARHFSLSLVSMANKIEIGYVFERANLGPLFSVIITADDVSVCKPAPDCYRAAFDRLNEKREQERRLPLLASECLAIEDSPPGIKSARVAGMHTLGVTNTVTADALRAAGAEVVTPSLADWSVGAIHNLYSDQH